MPKISSLPEGSAFDGSEALPGVQGGRTKRFTPAQMAAYVGAQPITVHLMDWSLTQSFQLVSGTRDANGALTSATIKWPDGVSGVFTADTLSTAFPGAIDAWHATYAGTPAKTVTQPAVTRDANGAVTVQPAITIS